jgi:elongation factor G
LVELRDGCHADDHKQKTMTLAADEFSRRQRPVDAEAASRLRVQCRVPLAEVTRYAAQLGSITQGQGSYTMEFSHYDQVPGNVQQQIVSKAKVAADEED